MVKVKGTMIVLFVKGIRADKSGRHDPFLTDQDRGIISQQILPSAWYPAETYKNYLGKGGSR
jgi:hypothetical protein